MTLLKYGIGGCGVALTGLAVIMALAPSGATSLGAAVADALAPFFAITCLGALALLRFAPDAVAAPWHRASPPAVKPERRARPEPARQAAVPEEAPAETSVRLIPGTPTAGPVDSWLGGCPHLPEGTGWPEIAGQPAQFLGQVDCRRLPAGIWRGQGPRSGSLVFFRADQLGNGAWPVRVMHVEGPVVPIRGPEGERLHPRWPLQVGGSGAGFAAERAADPDWALLHAVDLSNAAYQPFDWASAGLLLNRMKAMVGSCAKQLGTDSSDEDRAQLADTARRLADLAEAFMAVRGTVAFTGELRDLLMEGLDGLCLPEKSLDNGRGARASRPLTRHRCVTKAYFAPFERHCRLVFAADPETLPDAQRALFQPLWAHSALYETGSMGADEPEAGGDSPDEGDAMLLLELPSSELLGWTFGDARAFRIFVSAGDLSRGDLSRAWGNVVARPA